MRIIYLRRPVSGSHFRTVGTADRSGTAHRGVSWASCNHPTYTLYASYFKHEGAGFTMVRPFPPTGFTRPLYAKPNKPCGGRR